MRTSELKKVILEVFGDGELYGSKVQRHLPSRGVAVELSEACFVLGEMHVCMRSGTQSGLGTGLRIQRA